VPCSAGSPCLQSLFLGLSPQTNPQPPPQPSNTHY
jgi:hypothetical protein